MTGKREQGPGFSLSRWSRRKLEATRGAPVPAPTPPAPSAAAPTATGAPAVPAPSDLPPVESLSFDSDFTPFLRPEVDAEVKRAALKQLFRDPRFNVMDGLDTYIDDYTKADPIPPDVLADLLQRGFGRAPETAPAQVVASPGGEPADTAPRAERSAGERVVASAAYGEEGAQVAPGAAEPVASSTPREGESAQADAGTTPAAARSESR